MIVAVVEASRVMDSPDAELGSRSAPNISTLAVQVGDIG